MKKLTTNKDKIAKGALALVLASSVAFSTTNVFADEVSNQKDEIQSSAVQKDSPTKVTKGQAEESKANPSLVPGDFFYFVKFAFEKIQLALTFDDVKEAKLLASFASERLAEANALFAAGDDEKAIETINVAMEQMKDANKVIEEQQNSEQGNSDINDSNKNLAEDEVQDEQHTTNDKAVTNKDQNADEVTKEDQGKQTFIGEGQDIKEESGVAEVKKVLSQNIIALTAAMEKVKNPVAKAALQKNIEKSYEKLAKKLDKWEQKLAKKDERETKKKLIEKNTTKEENDLNSDEKLTNGSTTQETDSTETKTTTEATVKNEAEKETSIKHKAKLEEKHNHKSKPQENKQGQSKKKQDQKGLKYQEQEKKHDKKKHKHEGKNYKYEGKKYGQEEKHNKQEGKKDHREYDDNENNQE